MVMSGNSDILVAKNSLTPICPDEMLSDCQTNDDLASKKSEAPKKSQREKSGPEFEFCKVVRRDLRV